MDSVDIVFLNTMPNAITKIQLAQLFLAIEKHNPNCRGTNACNDISHLETKWIYDLWCLTLFRLNIEWDINGFIDNS